MNSNIIFPKKAMLMAAGLGLRMRPLTEHLPKPLLPVAGVTLIDRALDWFAVSGVSEAIVNSFYKGELLEAHLAKRIAPHIRISREDPLLETGGGIENALPLLGDAPFFSANSDTICIDGTAPALKRLWQCWDDARMDALLLLHPVEKAVGYHGAGDFFVNENGGLRRRGTVSSAPYVFTGVQLIHPRLFKDAPGGVYSLNVLYNRGMSEDGALPRIAALIHDGDWLHVGDPEGMKQAERWLQQH